MILKRLRLSFARRIRWTPLLLSACFTVCPGTFAEAQDLPVMDGLLLWLDATDSSTLFQDDALTVPALAGDPIGGWFDKSGNEFHATQPLDEARPTYDMTGISGLPAVSLSGSEASGMFISDDLQLLRPYTVFIVNQYDGPIHGRTLQSQDINWLHGLWGGNPAHYAEGWVSINRLAEDGVVYVEDATGQPGGDSTFFINGIDRTVSSAPAGEPGRLGLASVGMFPGEVSDADVAEIVIYDRVLDDSQLSTMREFFYDKYTVTRLDETIESPLNTVLSGEIGAFTGGDPDDGLDFSGNFVYAFDVGGPGGTSVGDANFEDGSELGLDPGTGVFITDANEIDAWHVPEYGDSVDDDALEFVMQSIRWNTPPGLEIDLPVEDGLYQLQLMFAENCCERGFDISVEGEMAIDNIDLPGLQEGIANPSQGVFFRDTISVTDGTLNILLGGENARKSDNNPILAALTLEYLGAAGPAGDFNGNGQLDAEDIDLLSAAISDNSTDSKFDVNGDGEITRADRAFWVEDLKQTYFGDSNLDGVFDTTDFVTVFVQGEYEDDIAGNSGWADGDWNGDTEFDSSDFVEAFQGNGFEQGPRAAVASVPEPASWLLALFGLGAVIRRGRRS